jgi:hypothetical protein
MVICKANKTCQHSIKNNGTCEHSIPHNCENKNWIAEIPNFDCNCNAMFLRELKLLKIQKVYDEDRLL